MKTFDQILQSYRELSSSEREKGMRFERLMQRFLLTNNLAFGWVIIGNPHYFVE